MVIGEAPGEAEAESGKPFMGKSGQLLRSELAKVGLADRAYITNIVKCRPPDNRAPTNDEIAACREYLQEEFETIKPKYVLTLGSPASKEVLSVGKITESHGKLMDMEKFLAMPAYHPAYTLYDMTKLPAFQQDLARLSRAISGVRPNHDVVWDVVNRENLDQFLEEFKAADEFSYDLETSGLFPYNRTGYVRCLGIGLWHKSWIVPLSMPDSTFFSWQARKDIMAILFELAEDKFSVAHNGKFDNQWMYHYYEDKNFFLNFDTMLASHLLDENRGHDLESLNRSVLDGPEYTPEEKKYFTISKCAKDVAFTLRLYKVFDRELRKDPALRKLFYKLIMPAARTFEAVERCGLNIDLKQMKVIEIETQKEVNDLNTKLNEMAGRNINWNSPQQVADVLFNQFKLVPKYFTEKGAPSTGEATLVEIQDDHPIAKTLVKYREATKFLSTYIHGWREYMVHDQLYLGYKLHGTVTGRYSSRLHQTPRDERIRSLVTDRGTWRFVQLDISQAEMRVAAIISGDLELRRCFLQGIDVHWRTLMHTILSGSSGEYINPAMDTARQLSSGISNIRDAVDSIMGAGHEACIEVWKGWKEARKKAKGINFGFLFGMFERKFIEYCKLKYGFEPSMIEAKRYRKAFFQLYPALEPWHNKQRKLAHLNSGVRNLAGRLRRLPGIHSTDFIARSEAERQGINSPVQGFVGDFKAMAAVEIHETIPWMQFHLAGEHHDALLGYVNDYGHMETLKKAADIMRRPKLVTELGIRLTIPMEVEVAMGPWGQGVTIKV
jgi:DNA polymerase-1